MSWADLALVIILGSFAASGAYRGLMRQVIDALSLVLSLVVAVQFYRPLARLLRDGLRIPLAGEPLAFAMLVVVVWSVTKLAGILVGDRVSHARHAWPDVLGGTLFGLLTGILLLTGLIVGLDLLGVPAGQQWSASLVGGWLLDLARSIIAIMPGI